MIIRTEAIVLRSMPYGETSRLVTLFTRERGKIAVVAKGARKPRSKFGSSLQVLSVVQAVIYHRVTRNVQTLSECAHIRVNRIDDLSRLAAGLRMAELTYRLMQDEEPQPEVYELLASVLGFLPNPQSSAMLLQLFYELQFATALGFAPAFDREEVRTLPSDGGLLLYENGRIVAEAEEIPNVERASRAALRTFATLSRARLEVVARLPSRNLREVQHLVAQYLRYHLAEAYPERAQKVLTQIRSAT